MKQGEEYTCARCGRTVAFDYEDQSTWEFPDDDGPVCRGCLTIDETRLVHLNSTVDLNPAQTERLARIFAEHDHQVSVSLLRVDESGLLVLLNDGAGTAWRIDADGLGVRIG